MANEPEPLAFPPDFAQKVIRRAQLERRRARRWRAGAAGLALLLGAAGIALWHRPARDPSLATPAPAVSLADDSASQAWLHSPLFAGTEERDRRQRTEDEPRRSPNFTGLNEVSETVFR